MTESCQAHEQTLAEAPAALAARRVHELPGTADAGIAPGPNPLQGVVSIECARHCSGTLRRCSVGQPSAEGQRIERGRALRMVLVLFVVDQLSDEPLHWHLADVGAG